MSSHPPPFFTGTNGPDVVVAKTQFPTTYEQWSDYLGLGGDDHITWWAGNVRGGPGNDTIVKDPGAPAWSDVWVQYAGFWWNGELLFPGPPAAVLVDLAAGLAQDGWGTVDTLVGIRMTGDTEFGDTLLGSSGNDKFGVSGGFDYVDGRAGYDEVHIGGNLATWRIDVSSDVRNATMTRIDGETWWATKTLANVEAVRFWEINTTVALIDLVDFAKVGPDTLVASSAHGWRPGAPGSNATLSFSFMAATPTYGGGGGGTGFTALNAQQRQTVRDVLARLSTEAGLDFNEVADTPGSFGQLRFGINQQAATKAYSYMPGAVPGHLAGDVWLDVETAQRMAPGQQGFQALLHEVGHALGLSHPLHESDTSGKIVLLDRWNDTRHTVMSEIDASTNTWRDWFGALDLQALRHLYGARAKNPGDDEYRFDDAIGRSFTTLVDDGGWNLLDVSQTSVGATIDLIPGRLSSIGRDADGFAASGNLSLASGSRIHEVFGTAFDDAILGDELANLLRPGAGNDQVDGRAGVDTVALDGARSDFVVARGIDDWTVSAVDGVSGVDTLVSIERLRFDDVWLALDLDGAAGQTAKVLGALFGPASLGERAYVGIGLSLFDSGMTLEQVCELAVNNPVFIALAGSASNTDFVRFVYANVFGAPLTDPSLEAYFVGALDSGALTKTTLAAIAAEYPQNLVNIDLVSLSASGIEFFPD